MADPAIKIGAEVYLQNTSKLERSIEQLQRKTRIGFSVDDRASLPLGRIAKSAADIDSSLDAATARVVSFSIAAGAVGAISFTFSKLAESVIEVEDALAKINVNFGATQDQLRVFSKEVFNAAINTGKTFNEAAKAAEELARQGLGVEETTKRLNNALILSRRAGIDSAEAVNTLTAAFNSYSSAGLDTTQIINKLVAVDTRFAVSTKDLSDAISRSASTAQEAGLTFDEFLGIVTSVQQTTARGGAVIGNALKTIFTRVQAAPETVSALERLGIAITDSSGAFTTAGERLRQYAQIRQTLSDGDKAYYDRIISGTQQINILTAALNDLGKANSVAAQAQQISLGATNEAIAQNEELNQTLKTIINETGQQFVQLFANIGQELGNLTKGNLVFGVINDLLGAINASESAIKGISNVLTGPGLAAFFVLALKAVTAVANDLGATLFALSGIKKESQVRLQIEKQIAAVTANATSEELKRLNAATSLAERRNAYLAIEQRVTAELTRQAALSSSLAQSLIPSSPVGRIGGLGAGFSFPSREVRGLPNFADPLRTAIQREIDSGVPKSSIYVDTDPRLKSPSNPKGLLVANRIDEPLGGFQGVNNALREGRNPKKNGFVPNFAEFDRVRNNFLADISGINLSPSEIDAVNRGIDAYKDALKQNSQTLQKQAKDYLKTLNLNQESRNFVQLVLEQEKKSFAEEFKQNKKIAKQKEELFREIEKQRSAPAGPQATSSGVPFQPQRRSPLVPEAPEIVSARAASIRGRRQYPSPIGPAFTGGGDIDFSAFDALTSSTRGGINPSEERLSVIGAASRRAFSVLERERLGEIEDALANQTLRLLSQSTLPDDKQIASIQKKIRRKALSQLESDPDFSRFISRGRFIEDAPKELIDLFDNRVAKELTSFESALSKARKRVIDNQNAQTIRSAFEGRRIGFFGKGDRKIAEKLLASGDIAPRNRELVKSILAEREQRRFQKRQTASFVASAALPFAAGFVGEGEGGTAGGIGRGLASGALQGGGIGALFGPVGIAVGAAVGGLVSAFTKLEKTTQDVIKGFEETNTKRQEEISGLQAFLQVQSSISDLTKTGGSQKELDRLLSESSKIEKTINSNIISEFNKSGRNIEVLSKILEQQTDSLTKAVDLQKSFTGVFSEVSGISSRLNKLETFVGPFGRGLLKFTTPFGFFEAAGQIERGFGGGISREEATNLENSARFAARRLPTDVTSQIDLQRLLSIQQNARGGFARAFNLGVSDSDLNAVNSVIDKIKEAAPEFASLEKADSSNFEPIVRFLVELRQESEKLNKQNKETLETTKEQRRAFARAGTLTKFSGVNFSGERAISDFNRAVSARTGRLGGLDARRNQDLAFKSLVERAGQLGIKSEPLDALLKQSESRVSKEGLESFAEQLLLGEIGASGQPKYNSSSFRDVNGKLITSKLTEGLSLGRGSIDPQRAALSAAVLEEFNQRRLAESTPIPDLNLSKTRTSAQRAAGVLPFPLAEGSFIFGGKDAPPLTEEQKAEFYNKGQLKFDSQNGRRFLTGREIPKIETPQIPPKPKEETNFEKLLEAGREIVKTNFDAVSETAKLTQLLISALKDGLTIETATKILVELRNELGNEFDGVAKEQTTEALSNFLSAKSDINKRLAVLEKLNGVANAPKVDKLPNITR